MSHKHNRLQKSWKYLVAALLASPSASLAMDLSEGKPSLPLPAAMAPLSGHAARLFSWYEAPGISHLPDGTPALSGPTTSAPSMSVLPFLSTTNVDTSGTGLSNLQLEPLRALKVVAPVTIPWNTITPGGTAYEENSLFGELPPASIEADPAALAALIHHVDWTRAATRELKHYDSWISGSGSKFQPTRISYTYVGPRSYIDYAYAQEAVPWHAAANVDLPRPSPLFMLPMWAASNLTDEFSGAALVQDSSWAGNRTLPADEAQLVSRNLGESEYEQAPVMMAAVDVFHLLDAGLSGVTHIAHPAELQPWVNQADMQNIFSQAGQHTLIAAEPEYHTTYSEPAPTSQTPDGQIFTSPDIFLASANGKSPVTLYIVRPSEDNSQESIAAFSAMESYSPEMAGVASSSGGMPRLAQNLKASRWMVASQHTPLAAVSGGRSGFGMPDPGSLALLALAGVLRTRTRKRPE